MTKEIQLTQGKFAIVDDGDYQRVIEAGNWHASQDSRDGRWDARRSFYLANGKHKTLLMHRFILGLDFSDPIQVDHKDRVNTLDNRRQNLRVTLNQNQQNVAKRKHNTSGYKGVSFHKITGKWSATIQAKGKQIHLGIYLTRELAATAYDTAALELHGEFAVTNQMLGLSVGMMQPCAA